MKSIPGVDFGPGAQNDQMNQIRSARDERTPRLRPVVLKKRNGRCINEGDEDIPSN
jgi:hypothetical protein